MNTQAAYKLLSENLTKIYGYAFSRLYDKDKADELASDIVFEILTSVKKLKSEDAFWKYAWKIAENTFRRFVRRKDLAAHPVELTEETVGVYESTPEEEYVLKETESEEVFLLRRELSLLKKTQREVCVAYYVDNKSCSQIAKEQDISLEMVKYHLFKIRKLLKEGIGMTRQLGEKSYNPGTFRLDFWCTSSISFSRFPRVVTLTEKANVGSCSRSFETNVPFPAPEGPEITSSIPFLVSFMLPSPPLFRRSSQRWFQASAGTESRVPNPSPEPPAFCVRM